MIKARQKWLSGCMAIAFTLSTILSPALAMAATDSTTDNTLRLGGKDRYETAAKIAQQGWQTSEYAVLSAGMNENLVDALTAAPLAKAKNAPILLTEGKALNAFAKQELTRLGVTTVYVTSGSGVIQKPVLDQLAKMGISVKSVGGKDRFETAINIAKELPAANELVVTTAWANADALSVASIAAAKGMPILLTDAQSINSSVNTYVDSIKTKVAKTYVLGGTGAVSESVKAALPNSMRIGGLDRYATNQEILKAFASDLKPGQVFVANGKDAHLVDSLAGSPFAALSKSPLVLIDGKLSEVTQNFVKLNLLPNKVVALGGEPVVGADVLKTLVSSTVYADNDAVKGSSDASKLEEVKEVLKVTGQNVTVKNTKASYSIYIQGDNATLDNVTVVGTVFVDPGQAGTATLKGVNADKIVVMSGAQDSIHIVNSVAGTLLVTSDTQTRVEATGTTTVGNTVVTSYAILDANGGSLGEVLIATEPGKDAVVELRGTFTEPVVVQGQATLKAADNAVIPSVIIATKDAEQKVTLDGSFKAVEVMTQAKVDLAANAKVESMETKANATIIVPPTATIDKFEAGNTETKVGGGGTVNNQKTSTTPTAPPPTTSAPPSGGSTGGTGGTTTMTISSVKAQVNGADVSAVNNTFDFSATPDSDRFTGLKLTTGQSVSNPTLVISSIKTSRNNSEWLNNPISVVIPNGGLVTTEELLGGLDSGAPGITFANLKALFGPGDLVLKGKVTKSGYSDSNELTITIKLGSSIPNDGYITNDYMDIYRDSKVLYVDIKQPDATIGEINSSGFDFARVAVALAEGATYSYQGSDEAVNDLKAKLQAMLSINYNNIELGLLGGRTIEFGNGYSIVFGGGEVYS